MVPFFNETQKPIELFRISLKNWGHKLGLEYKKFCPLLISIKIIELVFHAKFFKKKIMFYFK
ncbi:hypothetical protein HX13_06175 [Chryseobacterium sp. P1-3]|nr:hypothetical protein HX13_06175 [Chryseobacterium sp. P1-3]